MVAIPLAFKCSHYYWLRSQVFLLLFLLSYWNTEVEQVVFDAVAGRIRSHTDASPEGTVERTSPTFISAEQLTEPTTCQKNIKWIHAVSLWKAPLSVQSLGMCDVHSGWFQRAFSFPWWVICLYLSYILPQIVQLRELPWVEHLILTCLDISVPCCGGKQWTNILNIPFSYI